MNPPESKIRPFIGTWTAVHAGIPIIVLHLRSEKGELVGGVQVCSYSLSGTGTVDVVTDSTLSKSLPINNIKVSGVSLSFDWTDPDGDNDHWRLELTGKNVAQIVWVGLPSDVRVQPIAVSKSTDKNTTEEEAADLLQTTYYQQGYCAAKVEVKQDGSKRLFIVDPDEPFRVNLAVTGLHVLGLYKLMQDGPESGEVYSPTRINDWVEQVRKNYGQISGPLEPITWGSGSEAIHQQSIRLHAFTRFCVVLRFDHAHSQANDEIRAMERNLFPTVRIF